MESKTEYGIRENIKRLVKEFPSLMENYNALITRYWHRFDNVGCLEGIADATPSESITRNFRKLVADGEIAVPERVMARRKETEKEYRTEFSSLV